MHTQTLFGSLGLGDNQCQDDIDNQHRPEGYIYKRNGEYGQCHYDEAYPHGVDAEIAGNAGEHTAQQFVIGVTIEALLRHLFAEPFTSAMSGGRAIFSFAGGFVQLFGIAYAAYDFLYQCDVYRLATVVLQLQHQFGHAVFDVVGNLFASLLTGEVSLHVAQIPVEQLVSVFINGIQGAKEVDGDILFHCFLVDKLTS